MQINIKIGILCTVKNGIALRKKELICVKTVFFYSKVVANRFVSFSQKLIHSVSQYLNDRTMMI